ncbi:MAG: ArsO family NAD(P)H-dependent flavin-containing monooxygenase [Parvularculaceae bacterium]|nr:ArsO family NAD(P)H-dependent flavin-containing monooxygenase [Parvularculaceae bacterium]
MLARCQYLLESVKLSCMLAGGLLGTKRHTADLVFRCPVSGGGPLTETHDVIVVGGGQAGLATGYYLRRAALDFLILDAGTQAGGAWRHGWKSLRLFSPAAYSSMPGWPMPARAHGGYPTRDDVIDYLARYEARYELPVRRPVIVKSVVSDSVSLVLQTTVGAFRARAVVSATGTWSAPFVPDYPGRDVFRGQQMHSAKYVEPEAFAGQSVLIVGGGNSGAQILAEVSSVASTTWVTEREPLFLPDDVDGRVLFERATARLRAGPTDTPVGGIGDIVMVPPVVEARGRGALSSVRPFVRIIEHGVIWPDGRQSRVDAIIWCTGFRPALTHLERLGVIEADGRVAVNGQQSVKQPRLWLTGYGDWCGPGSATLIGASRVARDLVPKVREQMALAG